MSNSKFLHVNSTAISQLLVLLFKEPSSEMAVLVQHVRFLLEVDGFVFGRD